MFGGLDLSHLTAPKSVALQTRRRNDIANEQALEPDEVAIANYRRLAARHSWVERKAPCGVYNCAGHVLANRRTAIYDNTSWVRVLLEDGFRVLDSTEPLHIGDVALYNLKGSPRLVHIGLVGELRRLELTTAGGSTAAVPWVLSKWSDVSGEVLHHFKDVPKELGEWDVQWWTDRAKTL